MTKAEKRAVARIFSDLIKADRIVDTGEMECWQRLCAKYVIDREAQMDAQTISFAQAVESIVRADQQGLREDLLGDCRSMTVSDGFCAHSEAMLMAALTLALCPDSDFGVEVISIPKSNFNIDIATALYIENEYDAEVNEAIRHGYRTIFKELQLVGFHFVYLPSIIDHYRRTDPGLFRRILLFLAPGMSEEGLDNTCRSLLRMTTDVFCKDLLCNKCGITDLRDTYPALLFKIGTSFVGETPYANYLKIEVDGNITATVQSFVDIIAGMLSSDVFVVSTSEERDNQFHFHGFYKQLLDIFLIRRNIRSTIVIDPFKDEIFFPEIDARATGLHRRERALYALLLCQGAEGLYFSAPANVSQFAAYERRMRRVQERYAAIYAMLGGEPESAPDLTEPTIRRPIIACLRRSIKSLPALYNPDDYNVTKSATGVFSVQVEPGLVKVVERDSCDPVPLHESELYRRCQGI